ncbi:MAG TPA: hypothetical protein VNO52_12900 [Methylomirabilota bacterium]|nr:hypothetical protein [Methylomirabilota bacterium]
MIAPRQLTVRLLAAGRVVWWCADAEECAEYYGLTQRRAEELGCRLVNAYLPKAESAEQWPAPDAVFLSKGDIHDPENLLGHYREKHRLQAARRLPAFEVFVRPDPALMALVATD